MLRTVVLVGLVGLGIALVSERPRRWLVDQAKDVSDALVSILLRATSQFGSELTADGVAEQEMWRQQRLRDLRILARGGPQ